MRQRTLSRVLALTIPLFCTNAFAQVYPIAINTAAADPVEESAIAPQPTSIAPAATSATPVKTIVFVPTTPSAAAAENSAAEAQEESVASTAASDKKTLSTLKPVNFIANANSPDALGSDVDKNHPTVTKAASTPVKSPPLFSDYKLSSVIKFVLAWHPRLVRSEKELAQSQELITEARSSYYPSINLGVDGGIRQTEYADDKDKSKSIGLNLKQTLWDFGKTSSRINYAKSMEEKSQATLQKSKDDLVYEVTQAYLNVIRGEKLLVIAQEQIDGFAEIVRITKERSVLGASADSDYSQARVRLTSAIALMNDYKANLKKWKAVLNNLTNRNIADKLPHEFPELANQCSLNDVNSTNIYLARSQVETAKAQLAQAKSDNWPTVSFDANYNYNLQDKEDQNLMRRDRHKGTYKMGISLTVPVFQGGALKSRVAQAVQSLSAAEANLENEIFESKLKLDEARSQVQNTQESLEAKREKQKVAARTRDLYKLQYIELGNRSFSDLISAESEIHQTNADITNSEFTILTFMVECLYRAGSITKLNS